MVETKKKNIEILENLHLQQGTIRDLIDPTTGTWNREIIKPI